MTLIDVTELARRLSSGEDTLVDVRNTAEWQAGHIPGARHVPMADLASHPFDPADTYLIICRSGGRSAKAATALTERGLSIVDIGGGMLAWEAAGLHMRSDTNEPPTVIAP